MGKLHPSDVEIRNYLKEGYSFHQKKVNKKYTYIVIRKGQKMHSLGRYSDELWQRILRLEFKFSEEQDNSSKGGLKLDGDEVARARMRAARRIQSLRDKFKEHLELHRGTIKFTTCMHKDGVFCKYWVWNVGNSLYRVQQEFSKIWKEPIEVEIRTFFDKGKDKFVFRANPIYCANCTAYDENVVGAVYREKK